jgi:hypothetical protein
MDMATPRAIVFALVTSGLLACSEAAGPGDTGSSGTTGTTGTTTGTSTGVAETGTMTPTTSGTTGDSPAAAECEMAGGVCIGKGGCAMAGASVAATSPGGCSFDDGPGECCVPPAAKPKPKTCADAGGLCAPIGGCLDAGGYFTSIDKGCEFSGTLACCVPHERCGEQTIECCTDTASYGPACDNGKFVCMTGKPMPRGMCLPDDD